MHVAGWLRVVAQAPHPGGLLGIVGHDGAAFAKCTQVLSGVKAETPALANRSDGSPAITRAVSLARVFNNRDAVSPADEQQRPKVRGLAVEMYRQDRLGPRC